VAEDHDMAAPCWFLERVLFTTETPRVGVEGALEATRLDMGPSDIPARPPPQDRVALVVRRTPELELGDVRLDWLVEHSRRAFERQECDAAGEDEEEQVGDVATNPAHQSASKALWQSRPEAGPCCPFSR